MANSAAQPALDVACSNGLKGVVVTMEDDLRKKFGPIAITYGSTKQLTERATPATDAVIMSDAAIDALIAVGTLAAGRHDLARSRIGVAVRKGAPRPDISTLSAFLAALHKAKSVGRSRQGISGLHIAGELTR